MAKNVPNRRQYQVNRPGQEEAVRQTMYDFQTYANAGQTSLTFFQVPVGQSSKTLADTNMEVAGSMPQPKEFLVQSIEVLFFPGLDIVSDLTVPAESEFANDVYAVSKSGYLDFFIGSKSYLQEAPIGRFPGKTRLAVEGAQAVATTASAVTYQVSTDYAAFAGRPYMIDPNILLVSNQNFKVSLNWPAAVALPSGVDGRIGVVLDGVLYRESQ